MSIAAEDWIAFHQTVAPEREAMHDVASGRRFTYGEMHDRIDRAAAFLRDAHGLGRGDRAAVMCHNDSDVFEIQFACRRLGAIFLPLNWRLAVPELEFILNDAAPKLLLHGQEFEKEAAALKELCGLPALVDLANGGESAYERGLAAATGPVEPIDLTLDDVWTILYTSGTTGRPKGGQITYSMAHFNAVDCAITANLTTRSKNLVILPTFHTGGLNVWANPLFMIGGCNVVMRAFDPAELLNLMSDKDLHLTCLLGVPTNFLMMAEVPGFRDADLSHIDCIAVGGAAPPLELLRTYDEAGIRLQAMYGMTELGPLALALPPDLAMRKIGSSGLPPLSVNLKVCDEDGRPTPQGEVGELLVKGPSVTPGYWNRPEANVSSYTDDGWFKTGDAVRQDEDGFFYIVDRWKDMFISGGENVYPVEVENVIYQLSGVLENAVVGVPDEKWGEIGRAFIVLKDGVNLDEAAVIEHCKSQLATFKTPKQVRFIDELPHNATGKILKQELPRD